MPSHYLLDLKIRKTIEPTLKNAVIIFDEAHNIESAAEKGVSFDLTSNILSDCESDVKTLEGKFELKPNQCKTSEIDIRLLSEVITNLSLNFNKWRLKLMDVLKLDSSKRAFYKLC